MWNQPKITCPICGVRFRLPLGFTGQMIGCPGCWKVVNMSIPTTAAPPPARWRSWLTRALSPGRFVAASPGYREVGGIPGDPAVGRIDYNPSREKDDYALALEYTQKRYEEMLNLSEVLDKKLEGLARTSLAIGVLIATVARVLGEDTPLGRSPLLIWAVISFAVSVLVAVWSRGPTIYGTPLEIRNLLKVMDDHPDLTRSKTEAVLASSYHVAVVGTYATNEWKARQLWRATIFLLAGIVVLVAMLVTSGSSGPAPSRSGVLGDRSRPGAGAASQTRSDSSAAPSRSD